MVNECKVTTTKESAKKLAAKKETIISRLKNEWDLLNLTNPNYLGVIMVMQDAASVTYTLTNEAAKDQYYLYTDFTQEEIDKLALLYHNK
jgi:hypothetical protein